MVDSTGLLTKLKSPDDALSMLMGSRAFFEQEHLMPYEQASHSSLEIQKHKPVVLQLNQSTPASILIFSKRAFMRNFIFG